MKYLSVLTIKLPSSTIFIFGAACTLISVYKICHTYLLSSQFCLSLNNFITLCYIFFAFPCLNQTNASSRPISLASFNHFTESIKTWYNTQREVKFLIEVLGPFYFICARPHPTAPYISFSRPMHKVLQLNMLI